MTEIVNPLIYAHQSNVLKWATDTFKDTFEPSIQTIRVLNGWSCLLNSKRKSHWNAMHPDDPRPLTPEEDAVKDKIGMSLQSGHGLAKTTTLAIINLHILQCFPSSRALVTAPAGPQLFTVIWPELYKWVNANEFTRSVFRWNSKQVTTAEAPPDHWTRPRTIDPKATAEEQGETLAGLHAKLSLRTIDEACHDDRTDVLTDQGWMTFQSVWESVQPIRLATRTSQGYLEYQYPSHIHRMYYEGLLYHPKQSRLNFAVTPTHNMIYKQKSHGVSWRWYKKPIKNMKRISAYIPRTSVWEGKDIQFWEIPDGQASSATKRFFNKSWQLPIKPFLALLGWYFSEGSLHYRANRKPASIDISQKHAHNRTKIENTIQQLGLRYRKHPKGFRIHNTQLAQYFQSFGVGFDRKRIPRIVFDLSPQLISIFLCAFHDGDGYWKKGIRIFYTSSSFLVDEIQELIIKTGRHATIHRRAIQGQRKWIVDHWAETSCDGYTIAESKNMPYGKLEGSKGLVAKPYAGFIYCATVPNGTLYTRRGGTCIWSGNSGVPDAVMLPFEGGLTDPVALIVMGFNPTRNTGFAIETQRRYRDRWLCYHLDAEELRDNPPSWYNVKVQDDLAKTYGRDSNFYRVRVRGLPPLASPDTLIPWEWVMDATERTADYMPYDPILIGVDVAGDGSDRSVITVRRRDSILRQRERRGLDTMVVAFWTESVMNEVAEEFPDTPIYVAVDGIGIGKGTYDYLRTVKGYRNVYSVIVSKKVLPGEKYFQLRDKLYWQLRERFENSLMVLPVDDSLVGELTAFKWSDSNVEGKIKIEAKKDMRDRLPEGMNSPDKAESIMLTEYLRRTVARNETIMAHQHKLNPHLQRHRSPSSWKTV